MLRTLTGFKEPQGIGYVAGADTLYVANGGDGTVRLFQGADLTPGGVIALGDDADNVRVDEAAHRLFVGYGGGALAVIDTESRRKIADIALSAHPESFQLEPTGRRIFVNVPDAHQIVVIDRAAGTSAATWSTAPLRANFPLALEDGRAIAVFRHPPTIGLFDTETGRFMASVATCGDSDDVFADARRARIYVSCGEGFIDVLAAQGDRYASLGRIATLPGARTSIFSATIDRLFLAVRANGPEAAAIWVFRPAP